MLVHCVGAYSRTPTMAALYGARLRGIGAEQALRDVIGEALPNAHPNSAFRKALRRLQPRSASPDSPPEGVDDHEPANSNALRGRRSHGTVCWTRPLSTSEHVAAGHSLADAAKIRRLVDGVRSARRRDANGGHQLVASRRDRLVHRPAPGGMARRHHPRSPLNSSHRGALTSLTDSRGRTALDIRHGKRRGRRRADTRHRRRFGSYLKPSPSPLAATASGHWTSSSPKSSTAGSAARSTTAATRAGIALPPRRDPARSTRTSTCGSRCPACTAASTSPCAEAISTYESWCRVVGGSGQAHMITHEGAVLVDEGFV